MAKQIYNRAAEAEAEAVCMCNLNRSTLILVSLELKSCNHSKDVVEAYFFKGSEACFLQISIDFIRFFVWIGSFLQKKIAIKCVPRN